MRATLCASAWVASGCSPAARCAASFLLQAGDPDRLGPKRNIRGDDCRKFLGAVAEWRDAVAAETFGNPRLPDGAGNFVRDPVDDRPWRACRRHETVPGERSESRKARLGEGRQVG